jgi:hypothetical protein
MKFPAFVAVVFDYTRQPVQSYADYKALATYWRSKIDSLGSLKILERSLEYPGRRMSGRASRF